MAFALDPDLSLPQSLSSAALGEVERAMASLQTGDTPAIHDARKCCKKLRAWLKLLKKPLGLDYVLLNALVRDAAKCVAGNREATVARQTLRSLHRSPAIAKPLWAELDAMLEERLERDVQPADPEGHRAQALQLLRTARFYLQRLDLDSVDARALSNGLRKSFERSRRGFRRARDSGQVEALHEWRKDAKYYGYQRALVTPLLKSSARDRADLKLLKALSNALGRHHDLHMLELLLDQAGTPDSSLWRLHEVMRNSAQRQERTALRIGAELFGSSEAARIFPLPIRRSAAR